MFGGGEQLPDCGKIVLWDGIPWNWDWEAAPTRNKDPQRPRQGLGARSAPGRSCCSSGPHWESQYVSAGGERSARE